MKLSELKILLISLLSICFLNSCASLGTSIKVTDNKLLKTIKRIAVAPVTYKPLKPNLRITLPDSVEETFTDIFIDKLKDANIFSEIIPITVDQSKPLTENDIIKIALEAKADALLYIDLNLKPNAMFIAGAVIQCDSCDTYVKTKLVDLKTNQILFTANYNTGTGNSYMMPPPAERTINDAAKGTVDAIMKIYSKD